MEEAQSALSTYGLPELAPTQQAPGGWKFVVEPIGLAPDAEGGRFKTDAQPLVVSFIAPPLWVISRPNIDYNGASGTVQANDYGKGDSATLFVDTTFKGALADITRPEILASIKRCLTTKGKGFIEDVRVLKVKDGAPGYKLVEYTYEIESGAGFQINRNGIGSFAQVNDGGSLQIFWSAVVTPRWRDMQENLNKVVSSFRVGRVPSSIGSSILKQGNSELPAIGMAGDNTKF